MRVVFDTNIVISALVFGGNLDELRRLWVSGRVKPILCRETTAELLRVLHYPKFKLTQSDREALLQDYLPYVEVARLPEPLPLLPYVCRDRDDAVFIQLAIATAADVLVSGDKDLMEMQGLVQVQIMGLREFMNMLG